MYSRDEIKALTDKVLNMAKADAVEVSFDGGERSATRWANSSITVNLVQYDQQITVNVRHGQKQGSATTRELDDEGLKTAVDEANDAAQKARDNPNLPALVKGPQDYVPVDAVNQKTADFVRSSLDATAIGLIVNAEGSNVGIKVDAGGITLRPAGNLFDVAIDILIAHSMPNGELVKSFDKTLNLQLSREQRDQILQEGFTMSRTVDIRPSATALHVVVRDAPSGRAGSVSIPVQKTR